MKFPKNPLNELGRELFIQAMQKSYIATFGNCVVMYEPASDSVLAQLFDASKAEQKIGEILNANPDADLSKYENALGIRILDVQRPAPPPEDKPKLKKKRSVIISIPDDEDE
jgi:hypothetical protein